MRADGAWTMLGAMASATPVTVFPPAEGGGRRVRVDTAVLGTAYSLHDLTAFLQEAGLQNWDDLDVVGSDLIEWLGGGPDVWGTP